MVASLAKNPPKMMAEMLLKAQKYMNVEDALAAIKDIEKPRDSIRRKDDKRRDQKREHPDHRSNDRVRRKDDRSPWTVKFTPLIMPVDKILTQIRTITTSSGLGHCTHPLTSAIRTSIADFTKIMATTWKIVGI